MKKTLLFTTLSIAFLGNSQTFTQSNEAAIGSQTMYVCDSFIDKQVSNTGNGITWDFTDLNAYYGETSDLSIADGTGNIDFPASTKSVEISGIETFYNSTATERVSQGFLYTEPGSGMEFKAIFDTDEAKLMNYPFSMGSTLTDAYSGTFYYNIFAPASSPLSGEITVTIDGQGTLNLPNGVTLNNVVRVVSADSTSSDVNSPIGTVNVVIRRTQYEYYDLASSNLPVLIMATVSIESSVLNQEQTVVLYANDPLQYVGLNDNETVNFTIAPNPSTDKITLTGEFANDATGTIVDQNGKVMLTSPIKNGTTLDISTFANGIYFLNINSNGNTTSKTIVKK